MVRTYAMDVSKLEDWKDVRAKVEMDFGLVGLVMLNAGVMVKSGWDDVEYFHKVQQYPCPNSCVNMQRSCSAD